MTRSAMAESRYGHKRHGIGASTELTSACLRSTTWVFIPSLQSTVTLKAMNVGPLLTCLPAADFTEPVLAGYKMLCAPNYFGQLRPTADHHKYIPCPGHILESLGDLSISSRTTPLPGKSAYPDQETFLATIFKLSNVLILIAHDSTAASVIDESPKSLSDWKAKGWKDRLMRVFFETRLYFASAFCATEFIIASASENCFEVRSGRAHYILTFSSFRLRCQLSFCAFTVYVLLLGRLTILTVPHSLVCEAEHLRSVPK